MIDHLYRKAQEREAKLPGAGVRLCLSLALRLFFLPLLSPALSSASFPIEQDAAAAIRAYLNAARKNWNFQGSVLAVRDGNVVLKRGVGLADVKTNRLNTASTRFLIGSVSKTFTAAAVLQLEERGLLSLKDPIVKYLPGYPGKTGARITIQHLLSHTSGLPELAAAPEQLGDLTKPREPEDLIALFEDRPLDFEPGEKHQYSNSGYVVLGAIIEKVSGQSYYDYVRDHIFRPLGMKDSGCCDDYNGRPDFARGYIDAGDGQLMLAPYIHPALGYAAGALHSTVGDMLKWDEALSSEKILSRRLAAILFNEKYELPKSRSIIRLNPGLWEDYVGIYRIDADNFRVINREGDSLLAARNDGRKFQILPFARDEFFFPHDKAAFLRFTRDKSGRIDGHIFHQLGVDEKSVKL